MTGLRGPVPSLTDSAAWKRLATESRANQGLTAHIASEAVDVIAGIIYGSKQHSVTHRTATSGRPGGETTNLDGTG